jgi:hypothetical protein
MSVSRHVWTFGEADVKIYEEDSDGELIGEESSPIFTYCYAENIKVFSAQALQRRPIPGRGSRKIVHPSGGFDECNISFGHLFFRKSVEYDTDDVFAPFKKLRIVLEFFDLAYTGSAPLENDSFSLSRASAKSFQITSNMPDIVIATAEFEGELLI